MLRKVGEGRTVTVTDHGEPVAQISPQPAQRWESVDDVDKLLRAMGPDEALARDLNDGRDAMDPRDPWSDS